MLYTMPPEKDPCQILGLQPGASQSEIKKAYHKAGREHHPDHNEHPDSTQRMQDINYAYEILNTTRPIRNRTPIRAIVPLVQEENAHTASTSNRLARYLNKSVIGAEMETCSYRPIFVPSISGVLSVSYCATL